MTQPDVEDQVAPASVNKKPENKEKIQTNKTD